MILIGDENIPYETIQRISTLQEIKETKSNSVVLFEFDKDILQYTYQNDLESAVVIQDVTQSIYCHNLGVKYIICSFELAKKIQDLADHYLFDSKVLSIIESDNSIEMVAKAHIDGVIYSKVLGK